MDAPRPSTLHEYKRLIAATISPVIGDLTGSEITVKRLESFIDSLLDRPSLARNVRAVLINILNRAVQLELMPANPALSTS